MTVSDLYIVDETVGANLRWAGGITRIGARLAAGYERADSAVVHANNSVYVREALDISGPWGAETRVNNLNKNAVDPGWFTIPCGHTVLAWQGALAGNGIQYAERLAEGSYINNGSVLLDEHLAGYSVLEATFSRCLGKNLMLYDRKPLTQLEQKWDMLIRTINNDLTVSAPVLVVANAVGLGTSGVQTRATVAETGTTNGLVVTYPQYNAGGDHSIYAVRSTNGGTTWGTPFQIATNPGHDLLNPFTILLADGRLRSYFYVGASIPGCAYVESSDGGLTWGAAVGVFLPPLAQSIRMVMLQYNATQLAVLCNAYAQTKIGAFLLDID